MSIDDIITEYAFMHFAETVANHALQALGPRDGIAALSLALTTLAASTCYKGTTKEQAKKALLASVELAFDGSWDLPATVANREKMEAKK